MKKRKYSEFIAHIVALAVAIVGPLINLLLGFSYASPPPGMYVYWMIYLLIYIIILIPFTYKFPLTLVRLIILGITVEDFFSHLWRSLFLGQKFLPFCNWYTQHFPFLGSLGEPMPLLLIPEWYIVALFIYSIITIIQFRKFVVKKMRRRGGHVILVILFLLLIFLSIPRSKEQKLWALGSNLGTWGVKEPGEIDEPFVLNPVQRQLAKGVIGTLRINPSCETEECENSLIPDDMLLDLLDKIEEVDAEPFCVLSLTDWEAKHIVELFKGRVEYYEFGNEPSLWLQWSAQEYTEAWNKIVPSLKEIDSNIKIGGPAYYSHGCYDEGKEYIRIFLQQADPKPDFVSWHMYFGGEDTTSQEILDKAYQTSECIDDVENNVIIPTLGYSLPIIITEWNWNPNPDLQGDYRDLDKQFISDFTSIMIEEFKNNGYLLMAHQFCYGAHCANGHLAMIEGKWPYSDPKPQYDVFLHYAKKICPECSREK